MALASSSTPKSTLPSATTGDEKMRVLSCWGREFRDAGVVVLPVDRTRVGVEGVERVAATEDDQGEFRPSPAPGWNQADEVTRPPSDVRSREAARPDRA